MCSTQAVEKPLRLQVKYSATTGPSRHQVSNQTIDLGKTRFYLVALSDNGNVLLRKKFHQKQLVRAPRNVLVVATVNKLARIA